MRSQTQEHINEEEEKKNPEKVDYTTVITPELSKSKQTFLSSE